MKVYPQFQCGFAFLQKSVSFVFPYVLGGRVLVVVQEGSLFFNIWLFVFSFIFIKNIYMYIPKIMLYAKVFKLLSNVSTY